MEKNKNDTSLESFIPTDFTDVGQGTIFAKAFINNLAYCGGIGWLTYKNGVWVPSDVAAQEYSQKLTYLQLQEAINNQYSDYQQSAKMNDDYINFARSRRSSSKLAATLKEAIPLLYIDASDLDLDPFILNTPSGEVHLNTGEITPHKPENHITHITAVSPSDEGSDRWQEFLIQISCGDEEIIDFLQQIVGMAAIGRVYEERLIIAVGSGGNGKSTFFNAIQDVLGDYAGTIRSELLISSNDSGKKFEFARLRGKRFIVAEELEEGKELDTVAVKHLCSTGDINAQYKGKDIFTFRPSHSTVLCTNHLPNVKTTDNGTWDRLLIIPFNGRFRNQSNEIKNYGAYLSQHCGGAILKWIIEGAKRYIHNNFKLIIPAEIEATINNYKEENDWATDFFKESLIFKSTESAYGSELYDAYDKYCSCHGILNKPQNVVLPRIAHEPGVKKLHTSKGKKYYGVGINKPESLKIIERMHRNAGSIDSYIDSILLDDD